MPVDFSLLPPEQKLPDAPPSKMLWITVFLVLVITGVLAVLLFWPKGESMQGPWFWACVTIYPAGVAVFLVTRRYSVYEGRCLDVLAWNAARERHIHAVFEKASNPLAVLSAVYCFIDDVNLNRAEAIVQRQLALKAQPSIAEKGTVTARWLKPERLDKSKRQRGPETVRQTQTLEWLFDELLEKSAGALEALPGDLPLKVRLKVVADALEVDVLTVWKDRWRNRRLRPAAVSLELADVNLMTVDSWLDSADPLIRKAATLMVTIQLNAVLSENPPDGSAEAGAAVLSIPEDLCIQRSLQPIAYVHRPMRGETGELLPALTYALRWGEAEPKSIARLWLTGLEADGIAPLHAALGDAGVTAGRSDPPAEIDMNRTVGHAGAAASWLSLACAAASAQQFGALQLLAEQNGNEIVAAVVAPQSRKKSFGVDKLA